MSSPAREDPRCPRVGVYDAQWEGMGDVGSARYEPALLPPCPTIVTEPGSRDIWIAAQWLTSEITVDPPHLSLVTYVIGEMWP